jgi:NAD(P)-dependent dehydrogenase (short-subunit alcohol dehydrogenase family)
MDSAQNGTIIVTGASGVLGKAVISQIASRPEYDGYHGIFTARTPTTASTLQSHIKQVSRAHSHRTMCLDLSMLDSVRSAATEINALVASGKLPPIRALILNAGYVEYNEQTWSEDGLDMSFVSNYLGHWLLVLLLLRSMDKAMGRVIVLSSWSYK